MCCNERLFDGKAEEYLAECAKINNNVLLHAVKMAYRKHHLSDPSIGWDELSDILLHALCEAMGDEGYDKWLKEVSE